jgi:REP element-mobilizing transposase RayT
MKRRHSLLDTPGSMNFITTAVIDFIYIFNVEALANIVLDNIKHYVLKYDIRTHGFVIMPNHLHLLLSASDQAVISKFMGKFKEYSAKEIISWCMRNKRENLLAEFADAAVESKRGHRYQVWQHGFDNVAIIRKKDMLIKLNYIHNNPLQERWRICQSAEDYHFSSAGYYRAGRDTDIPISKIE